jgi:hypothetical protein
MSVVVRLVFTVTVSRQHVNADEIVKEDSKSTALRSDGLVCLPTDILTLIAVLTV